MKYFTIEPEVAGGFGPETVANTEQHPPIVSHLHYVFEGWLGDDIVESFPCYIITLELQNDLQSEGVTGAEFADALVTTSPEFAALQPDVVLPQWRWMKITGVAGKDDIGRSEDHRLVVSQRVLSVLRRHALDNCDVEDYT